MNKKWVIKRDGKYVSRKVNGYCLAWTDNLEEAKRFKSFEEARKYIKGYTKMEIIEI